MRQPIRILHVHSGNIFGGVESILLTLVRHRDSCPDLRMAFALCFDDRLQRELVEANCEIHALGPVRVSRPWTIWRARRALRELLQREAFDAVLVHSAWSHAIFAPVARREGKPVIWWLHGCARGTNWSERWAKWTKPDFMICVSQSVAQTIQNLFHNVPRKVIYAPLPTQAREISPEDRKAIRQELRTPQDAVVIIQVSRIEAGKGHTEHLKALGKLKHVPNWICWQIGGPHGDEELRYFQQLQKMASDLGVADRVRFLGKRTDVLQLLGAADLFCQPNVDTEGFSIAFMEAFMAGLPIVTTAIGGAVEIVDETCGVLLPQGRMDLLPETLHRLISDPYSRRQLGKSGYERVHQLCDPSQQINKLRDTFEEVISRSRQRE